MFELVVIVDKDVKVVIIIYTQWSKVYSEWKKDRKSQQKNRNYYFKNMEMWELQNTVFEI